MKNCIIVIPVLDPNDAFTPYVKQLISEDFKSIIIVNDGSSNEKTQIFEKLDELPEVTVLTHAVNMGKGRALKNAFNYILNDSDLATQHGVITVDGDGQHKVSDVLKLCSELEEKSSSLLLGVRHFQEENVPWTSRMGNTITRHLFRLLYGKGLNDTQTGLRGISTDVLPDFAAIEGERYSYETNMLIVAVHKGLRLKEVPIATVYIEDNEESHFNPVKDSIEIYVLLFKNFFKFMSVSFTSFLIDISFFQLFLFILGFMTVGREIIIATILARAVSSFFNFSISHKWVFESKKRWNQTLFSYYGLVAVQALISGVSVYWLFQLTGIKEVILKVFVDAILFMISYRIQKLLIFKSHEK
ncbi:dolichol-phosphate mannosyltransferase [Alkalibacterium putridalgicola]|uniref:Dolichol-phosphate mannosyltransferase n=1 Tax=Alkalibacterium putridalgicola TaxID=426703 RepID=A0A1H7TFZ4_9LACT|nr:bifunctional glycosyltransferase family 2/GtrA family protein [Alkalibacterium putridalgicola]GEK89450.1 dolichol-phosphate mannosyltransferase [Alkalibacterium putridalgicola]SEL83485.1 dolichol-phosphate mannosyltransferase [Alkalibacterium putridalgicola]